MPNTPAERADRPLATLAPPADLPDEPIEIRAPVVRIGQGPQNDIVLADDTVSTNHARLEFSDGAWRLIDLESRNGTYVDGVRLAAGVPTPLLENAQVAFGAMKFGFAMHEGAAPEVATDAYPGEEERKPATVRRAGFRLPVWLVVLVLLFIALLTFLFVWFGGDPQPVGPAMEPVVLLPEPESTRLAA
jgi:hypothetical protein